MSEYINYFFEQRLFSDEYSLEKILFSKNNSNYINSLNENYTISPSQTDQPEVVIEITKSSKKKNTSRSSQYNILRKIQIHFLNFIVQFLNDILKAEKINNNFFSLEHDFKYKINKKNSEELKQQQISDIICHNISKKFKNYESDKNSKTFHYIENNEILKKILSINYLTLFKRIYYKSNKKINLKEFGINKEYILSKKVKMFKDLLNSNDKKGKNYIKKIQICAVKNYLPEYIFSCES